MCCHRRVASMCADFWRSNGPLRNQDDLSVGARLQDLLVSAGSLGEWQLLPDDRPQSAILHSGDQSSVSFLFVGFGDAPYGEGLNRAKPGHEVTRGEGNVTSAANHDNAASSSEQL